MEQEIAFRLQNAGIRYQTQIEIPVTTADFYFATEPRPLIVFVDGRVHLGKTQAAKEEELRSLLRKRGYRVPGVVLRQLLGQEEKPAVRADSRQPQRS